MARLAGGTAAANALLGLIAARADAAPLVAADDARIKVGDVRFSVGAGREMAGYLAQPAKGAATAPRVLVIHENRGLNDHIRDVARRLAAEGLVALAADFLAPNGGTPTLGDGTISAEDTARTMIGALDRQQTVADGVATLLFPHAEVVVHDLRSQGHCSDNLFLLATSDLVLTVARPCVATV